MRAMVVRTGKPPAIESVSETLEDWQKLVGGNVQCIGVAKDLELFCNEDGIQLRLPLNRRVVAPGPNVDGYDFVLMGLEAGKLAVNGEMGVHVIRGDFFVVRVGANGDVVDLTDGDETFLKTILS